LSDPTSIIWYEHNASTVANQYESVTFDQIHDWLISMLPDRPGVILDVGAGTGRDAAWLAAHGHEVVAVEPSAAMRAEGGRRHPDPRIRWIPDRLPGLDQTFRLGVCFDFILLSAVWMHVPPTDRGRAFRKLITLLKPGGFIAITLRNGRSEVGRAMYPVGRDELERLAREHGAFVELVANSPDRLNRNDIGWTQILIRLPDDGTGALPLLRHIVLGDAKSSTYKLALLRTVARIADSAAGMTQEVDDEHVAVPLGLIALFWIRMFKPLIKADLPQTPTNRGMDGLGFIRDGFRALDTISHLDLRVSARFQGTNATAVHQALRDACDTVAKMPANYITYPNGGPILKAHRRGRVNQPGRILLNQEYLASFGELRIPTKIWRALERFDAWIEPALISEWGRLMKTYAESQGRRLDDRVINSAMAWSDPARDVALVRQLAINQLHSGIVLCVWTGRELNESSLDIDHCLPWSAWPCDDLWNLMPAQRVVNQKQKRDRLPSAERLGKAQDLILSWWSNGYFSSPNATIPERFLGEARASLPSIASTVQPSLDDIFSGVALQRLRLKQDQQVPEWI